MTNPVGPPTPVSPEQPPGSEQVMLPTASPSVAAASAPQRERSGKLMLGFLVLALAFLAGSFVARNSDLWQHLATGRLLAARQLSVGTDPFAYTTEGAYWVCHGWLFDLLLYRLYLLHAGGAVLVVAKALLVAAVAGLLLQIRRPVGAGLPELGTTLALLAMTPRLLLQPVCVSYLLLALTLWLLFRIEQAASRRASLLLPAVMVLWVNVDEWFLLGPIVVALSWLGERLAGRKDTPTWLIPATLAACLVNPHTYHVFRLPDELSIITWSSGLRQDVRFAPVFASPWHGEYLQAAVHLNLAALAYFLLTFLGLASFALHRPALRDGRLLLWLPFASLAAWQARAIPFFAIVGTPLTVLNLQDYLTSHAPGRRMVLAGRLVLGLALLGLLVLSWPGWLTGYEREDRHVAWGIQADPSLQQATETLAFWSKDQLLPASEHVFALAPEVAQYGAWFCPQEKHFFDQRYSLYPLAAHDYETVCRALQPELVNRSSAPEGDWRQILRSHKVSILVYYERDPERLFAVLRRLTAEPEQWTLLHVAGQALLIGWNEARPPGGFASLALDPDRLVFGPTDARSRREAPVAPEEGPKDLPDRRDRWARIRTAPPSPTWESPAATLYLHYFHDSEAEQRQQQWLTSLRCFAAGLAGLPAQTANPIAPAMPLIASRELLFPADSGQQLLTREQLGPYFAALADHSPALPLLAVRAARRAVAANPEDAVAWLRLGQAYLDLRSLTREYSSEGLLPPLAQLRHVQIATALEQAVRLDPDLEKAHEELAFLYGERSYLDRALEHRQQELRLSRRAGPRPGESAEAFSYRAQNLEKDTAKLEELVENGRKRYAAAAGGSQGDRLAQASLALRLGLAQVAVEDVLLATPADLLGAPGIQRELEMLLLLGRVQEVRTLLANEALRSKRQGLGSYGMAPPLGAKGPLYVLPYQLPAYEWLHVLAAAGVGDYAQAHGELDLLRSTLHPRRDLDERQTREVARRAWDYFPAVLTGAPLYLPALSAHTFARGVQASNSLQAGAQALRAQEADLCVLDGLLALEQGDPLTARQAFVEAQTVTGQGSERPAPYAGRPIAVGYLEKLTGFQGPMPTGVGRSQPPSGRP